MTIVPEELRLVTRGSVSEAESEYAREKLWRAVRDAPRPVLDAHAELRREVNPSLDRPAIAKVTLDVGGRRVRAHVAARGMYEAVDLLEARLTQQLRSFGDLQRAHDAGVPASGEWRHADVLRDRPEFHPRPVEEREIRRTKAASPVPLTPDEAALEMVSLSYSFFLFHDATSGAESVLYRRAEGELALMRQSVGDSGGFDVDPAQPAWMRVEDAAARLDLTDDRFVFFCEPPAGRGALLYRRFDGHYGLLSLASAASG